MRKQLEDVKEEEQSVAFVRQESLSKPIELCFGPGDHTIKVKQLSPLDAIQLGMDLIEKGHRTLAHRKG